MKKKILVVLPWMPYPLDSGGNQGVYNMLEYVSRYYNIYLWFPIFYRKEKKTLKEFEDKVDGKYVVLYSFLKIGFNYHTAFAIHYMFDRVFLRNDIQHIHSKYLWVKNRSNYTCLKIVNDLNNIIKKYEIDCVQIEFMPVIKLVYALPVSMKKVFVHHELQFVKFGRQLEGLDDRVLYDDYRCRLLKATEIATLNQFDRVITLTETDKVLLEKERVLSKIEVSPLFIPPHNGYPEFKPATKDLVFIAGAKHAPNKEALDWFANTIMPILMKKGDFHLYVIGREWDKKTYNSPKITFLGFVDDLSNIVPGKIMIIPILSGSGMRMKILEAVNNSVPFVSTSVGAEGMGWENNVHCYIEDVPEDFAKAIIRLSNDKELQKQFVLNARTHYEQVFSPNALGDKRVKILDEFLGQHSS